MFGAVPVSLSQAAPNDGGKVANDPTRVWKISFFVSNSQLLLAAWSLF